MSVGSGKVQTTICCHLDRYTLNMQAAAFNSKFWPKLVKPETHFFNPMNMRQVGCQVASSGHRAIPIWKCVNMKC